MDKIIRHAQMIQDKKNSMQQSLFGEDDSLEVLDPALPECEHWSKLQQLRNEKDVTGFYISGHPLDDFKIEIDSFCNTSILELNDDLRRYYNKLVTFAGMITETQNRTAKNGKPFGTFVLEDFSDSKQFILFSEDYLKLKHLLVPGSNVMVKAKIEKRFGRENQLNVKIVSMNLIHDTIEKFTRGVAIILHSNMTEETVKELAEAIKKSKGKQSVRIKIADPGNGKPLDLKPKKMMINASNFVRLVEKIPGISYKLF